MPIDIGREMALPMEQIIGGPLQAVIRAQSLAASASAQFIREVGLEEITEKDKPKYLVARTIDFSFNRLKPLQNDGTQPTQEKVNLIVPLLTIVPIPFIRIQEAIIEFECKVSSSTLDTSAQKWGVEAKASGGFWGVSFSVNASYSQQSTHEDKVDKTATLKVTIKAVQDDMPGGLKKMLDILQTAIVDGLKPAATPTPLPAP
jgi:Protein of unknown function (DUF2589)